MLKNEILRIRRSAAQSEALIHCITNPISINDCANLILALGGKPIMAEHPLEVGEITASADALYINTGNITDVRMESIRKSAETAGSEKIPVTLDAVGIGCSTLRFNYVSELIKKSMPSVIKGNMSEIKKLCGLRSRAKGIDCGISDIPDSETVAAIAGYAGENNTVIEVSGRTDIITDGKRIVRVSNGVGMMSRVTGTGCMLGAVTALFSTCGDFLSAAAAASAVMGIAGEMALELMDEKSGTATFHIKLLDSFAFMSDNDILDRIKITEEII